MYFLFFEAEQREGDAQVLELTLDHAIGPMSWMHRLKRVFHIDIERCGLQAGGVDEGAPGPRPDDGPGYYGAFLRDPDGHKVEAAIVPGAS